MGKQKGAIWVLISTSLLFLINIAIPVHANNDPQKAFDDYIRKSMTEWQVPGLAVVVVKGDETVLMKGYGTRAVSEDLEIDEKTYVQIASNSKTFTAFLFGMLVDDGLLRWGDPIKKYIPELELADPYVTEHVAIDDLLCHRSGLSAEVVGDFQNRNYTIKNLLQDMKGMKLALRFRSGNLYSQIGMALLGEVVFSATTKSWEETIKQRIFKPLGMESSYTSNLDFENRVGKPETVANIMHPAIKKNGVVTKGDWAKVGTEPLYAPAGGIISNMEDIAKWMSFRLNNGVFKGMRLISLDAINEIRKPRLRMAGERINCPNSFLHPRAHLIDVGYGQWSFEHRGRKVIVHNGGWMSSVVAILPDENIGIGIFSNAYFYEYTPYDSLAFVNAVVLNAIDHYLGYDYVDWPNEMLEIVKKSK